MTWCRHHDCKIRKQPPHDRVACTLCWLESFTSQHVMDDAKRGHWSARPSCLYERGTENEWRGWIGDIEVGSHRPQETAWVERQERRYHIHRGEVPLDMLKKRLEHDEKKPERRYHEETGEPRVMYLNAPVEGTRAVTNLLRRHEQIKMRGGWTYTVEQRGMYNMLVSKEGVVRLTLVEAMDEPADWPEDEAEG